MNVDMFNNIPEEVILSVLQYLSPKDLAVVSLVCKRFSDIASEHSLWRLHCWSDFRIRPLSNEKTVYKQLYKSGVVHKLCLSLIYSKNSLDKLKCSYGLLGWLLNYKTIWIQQSRFTNSMYQLYQVCGQESNLAEELFHNMLNSFQRKFPARNLGGLNDSIRDFFNFPPASAIRNYQISNHTTTLVRLKKGRELSILVIRPSKDFAKESLSEDCYAELFRVNVNREGSYESKALVDTLMIYDSGFPKYNVYSTINSYFAPRGDGSSLETVDLLKDLEVDCKECL